MGYVQEAAARGCLQAPLHHLAQAWPYKKPLWFLILMSQHPGVSLEGRMTNCCPLLISFVVKSPLILDCLVETELHQTQ